MNKNPSLQPKAKLNNAPPLIKALLKKFGDNRAEAARALGYTTSNPIIAWGTGRKSITPEDKTRIQAVIDGDGTQSPVHQKRKIGFEKTAIVISKADLFEQLYDVAKTMGGEWRFKKKAGSFWIGVVQMNERKLTGFLALATAQGVESYTT